MSDNAGTGGLLPIGVELHGRYRILRVLGRGGMSAVYEGEHLGLGRQVAIKEMHLPAHDGPDAREAVTRFQNEARTLARLEHRYFPDVTDFFSEDGRYYLVMEYIDGETLDERVRHTQGFLPEDAVLQWAAQLCDVLSYLHAQSPPVVFRDLKPSNVMVDEAGKIKLIDFGIARIFKPGKQSDTQSMGTAGYSSPEQYGTGQTDARSDIYSLGACLHFLLTRRDPTASPFNFPPAREINPKVSATTERVVARCLSMKPEDRYASAEDVKKAILAPLHEPDTTFLARPATPRSDPLRLPMPTVSAPPVLPPARRQPWSLIALILIAIAVFAGLGAYIYEHSQGTPPSQSAPLPAAAQPAPVAIPDLTNQAEKDAEQALANLNLTMEREGEDFSPTVPRGIIDRQDPVAGTMAQPGQAVKVWVSAGPAYVQVPDISSMSVDQAGRQLAQKGLHVGKQLHQNSSTVPAGYVIDSAPPARFKIAPNQSVDLIISDGPLTTPTPAPAPTSEPDNSGSEPSFNVTVPVPNDKPHDVLIQVKQPDGATAKVVEKSSQGDVSVPNVEAPSADSFVCTVDGRPVTPQVTPVASSSGTTSSTTGTTGSTTSGTTGSTTGPAASVGNPPPPANGPPNTTPPGPGASAP